jgi:hypothetical protein
MGVSRLPYPLRAMYGSRTPYAIQPLMPLTADIGHPYLRL